MTNNVQLGKNAKCENSKFGLDCIIYRDAEVINSFLQHTVNDETIELLERMSEEYSRD